MRIFVPRESYEGENRVATTPSVVRELKKLGYEISIEEEAGKKANFSDISSLWNSSNLFFNIEVWW